MGQKFTSHKPGLFFFTKKLGLYENWKLFQEVTVTVLLAASYPNFTESEFC